MMKCFVNSKKLHFWWQNWMFVLNYHGHKKVMFWNRLRWLAAILAQQKYNEKCQENSTISNLSEEGFAFRCDWFWKSTVVLMNYRQDTDKREEWSLAWIEGGKLPFVVRLSRRILKERSSRRMMRLVPVFILETHNQTNYKCLLKFVQMDNASLV